MKVTIIILVLGVYLVLAFVIARLCAVNAGWEKIARVIPGNGERGRNGLENGSAGPEADFPGAAKTHS
ncbi:MAG: hypothetical protein JW958_05125 [Candidatus Eisenbacteria bacterium]|nr:hypothetical protein [Candidatus Eisenbacteria bacterium]